MYSPVLKSTGGVFTSPRGTLPDMSQTVWSLQKPSKTLQKGLTNKTPFTPFLAFFIKPWRVYIIVDSLQDIYRYIQIVFELVRYSIFTLTAPENRKISGLVQGKSVGNPLYLMVKTTVFGQIVPTKPIQWKIAYTSFTPRSTPSAPHTSPQLAMETPLLEKRMSKIAGTGTTTISCELPSGYD